MTFENGYWWEFKITEYIPHSKITWHCTDGEPEFNKEWIGNTLYWTIEVNNNSTKISFLHEGLTPQSQCYAICAPTWNRFITEKLKAYLSLTD